MEPRWHVTYTSGTWVVLAGPTSVVAIDPRGSEQGDLAGDLWSSVNSDVGMAELVTRLAAVDVAQLPRLAVLFFEREGNREVVRALLRGDVRVLAESGQTVAHGADVLTWQEVRLADLPRIEVDLGGNTSEDTLPLVRGAVRAGRLRLSLAQPAGDETPQRAPASLASLPPDAPEPDAGAESEAEPTAEVPFEPFAETSDPTLEGSAPAPSDDDVEEMENADTELIYLPPPAVARLRAPDGSTIDLDRPVLIGRAPSDSGFENSQPHLLTVPSPSQDISRTHVLVAPEGDLIVVTDLHSTNGTTVVKPGPGVERVTLPSGQSVTVEVGSVLELGDEVAILIDASP